MELPYPGEIHQRAQEQDQQQVGDDAHTFAVHGEPNGSSDFMAAVEERLGWEASVPGDGAEHAVG